MSWCLVNNANGHIVNIINWNGETEWPVPAGYSLRPYEEGDEIWQDPVEEQ